MLTIILDGYNVIHAVPELARQLDHSLEAARRALLALCRAYPPLRGDATRLYVVFDGDRDDADARAPQESDGKVTVLFTDKTEEADERILSVIRVDAGRSRFIVVSNDTHIHNNARALGARVMSVQEFYGQLRPARTARCASPAAAEKMPLSAREAQQITEEYRKRLNERSHRPAPPQPSRPGCPPRT